MDATMSCAHEVAGRGQTRERSRAARKTSGSVADGEVVWFWRPRVGAKVRGNRAEPDRVNTSWVPGKSTKEAVKTIAWGMPDVSGASAVNTCVHTY